MIGCNLNAVICHSGQTLCAAQRTFLGRLILLWLLHTSMPLLTELYTRPDHPRAPRLMQSCKWCKKTSPKNKLLISMGKSVSDRWPPPPEEKKNFPILLHVFQCNFRLHQRGTSSDLLAIMILASYGSFLPQMWETFLYSQNSITTGNRHCTCYQIPISVSPWNSNSLKMYFQFLRTFMSTLLGFFCQEWKQSNM